MRPSPCEIKPHVGDFTSCEGAGVAIAPQSTPRRRGQWKVKLVADLFCGAGGSSTGASRALAALGFGMELVCVNHWPVAIDTHRRNHPSARHFCQDVAALRPREAVPGGRLDLLMASPTCTHHSRARGGRPTSDQQRMDPWHVITWLTELRVSRLIIENVPEFQDWGPVNERTGRPVASRKGEYFRGWVAAIKALGFRVEWRVLNAADFGDATTRLRFFLMARSDGRRIVWPEPTHSREGGRDLFGERQRWRPAREIIDWSLPGKSIFERKKPLAIKTMARILAGAQKFRWPEPFLVVLRQHMGARSVDAPVPAVLASGNHIAVAEQIATPFVLGQQSCSAPRDTAEPLMTVAVQGAISLIEPCLVTMKGRSNVSDIDAPAPAITTMRHLGVAAPMISPYYGGGSGLTCAAVDDPLDAVTTKARFGLVEPLATPCLICVAHGEFPGENSSARRVHSLDAPVPGIVASNRQYGLCEPIVIQTDQTGGNGVYARAASEPLFAQVTKQNQAVIEGAAELVTSGVAKSEWGKDALARAMADGRLVEIDGAPHVLDIRFRMLEPYELAAAMGFSDEETTYEFSGNKAEVTKQVGNAVPVRTAAALVSAIMAE